jgi:hypothetical protein
VHKVEGYQLTSSFKAEDIETIYDNHELFKPVDDWPTGGRRYEASADSHCVDKEFVFEEGVASLGEPLDEVQRAVVE